MERRSGQKCDPTMRSKVVVLHFYPRSLVLDLRLLRLDYQILVLALGSPHLDPRYDISIIHRSSTVRLWTDHCTVRSTVVALHLYPRSLVLDLRLLRLDLRVLVLALGSPHLDPRDIYLDLPSLLYCSTVDGSTAPCVVLHLYPRSLVLDLRLLRLDLRIATCPRSWVAASRSSIRYLDLPSLLYCSTLDGSLHRDILLTLYPRSIFDCILIPEHAFYDSGW